MFSVQKHIQEGKESFLLSYVSLDTMNWDFIIYSKATIIRKTIFQWKCDSILLFIVNIALSTKLCGLQLCAHFVALISFRKYTSNFWKDIMRDLFEKTFW